MVKLRYIHTVAQFNYSVDVVNYILLQNTTQQ